MREKGRDRSAHEDETDRSRPCVGVRPQAKLVEDEKSDEAKERRLGEFFKRNTLMFNGYADQVSQLYAGMDLRRFY